ncbi:hypothetical protein L596_007835 [Steinernema carpocapsae]|uniref:Ig-like domain-containing protein n=1 Tax=Steinernema carpocapsae TaxID=34508 RepID=A0A4U5PB60_STECR|nr:hypothetical protein L596_007835 [Steinernema carpocapsae]
MSNRVILWVACAVFVLSGVGAQLQAEGSLAFLVPVQAGRSQVESPLKSSEPLTLWCQIRDRRRGSDVAKIKEAHFTRTVAGKQTKVDDVGVDLHGGRNASLTFEDLDVAKAGRYTCHITAENGQNVNGNIEVYARPVLLANGYSVKYIEKEDDPFHLEASSHTLTEGTDLETFTCHVIGYPKPTIKWTFNAGALPESAKTSDDGETLTIENIEKQHQGTYTCTASNEFKIDSKPFSNKLVIDRQLNVKHWLSFLIPLGIIIILLLLLGIVISLCECRRKKNEQQLLEPATEE